MVTVVQPLTHEVTSFSKIGTSLLQPVFGRTKIWSHSPLLHISKTKSIRKYLFCVFKRLVIYIFEPFVQISINLTQFQRAFLLGDPW